MLMLISPAKKLDYDSAPCTSTYTTPDFLSDSQELIDQLRGLDPNGVSALMSLSDKLGQLNHDRYQSWSTPFTPDNAKQAVLAFRGDVYKGMNADSFSEEDFRYAQDHLRILSGLYGLLRPLDLMQPYRLEMGTKFQNKRGKNLYEFWGTTLTETVKNLMKDQKDEILVNLASNEYYSSIQPQDLGTRIITPVFKDWKNGKYKIVSFYAKRARGMMTSYIIRNRIEDPEGLKGFDTTGYAYSEEESDGDTMVFLRKKE